jgi:hypothetical protein
MAAPKPLDSHQRELVNLIKAAHRNLGLARDTRKAEEARRLHEAKLQAARDWEKIAFGIRDDLDRELTEHASALDEALIAAYEAGVPVRAIALQGFGNQFDGGVQGKLRDLRQDGRLGMRHGHQRNKQDAVESHVAFPTPIDVEAVLEEATTVALPTFEPIGRYVLFEATAKEAEVAVDQAVLVTMDSRDPFFRDIEEQASFSADRGSLSVVLYDNPFKPGELRAPGLNLDPKERWMNRVAYWVALHPVEAREQFDAAVSSAK